MNPGDVLQDAIHNFSHKYRDYIQHPANDLQSTSNDNIQCNYSTLGEQKCMSSETRGECASNASNNTVKDLSCMNSKRIFGVKAELDCYVSKNLLANCKECEKVGLLSNCSHDEDSSQ